MRSFAITAMALIAGCNIIAGYPDYSFTGSSSQGGAGATGAAGGMGGEGAMGAGAGGSGGGGMPCAAANECTSPLICKDGMCEDAGIWSRQISGDADQTGVAVAVGPTGTVALGGNDDGLPLFSMLRPDGSVLVQPAFTSPDALAKTLTGVAYLAQDDRAVLAGEYTGMLTLGGGQLTADGIDVFMSQRDADGLHQGSATFGGPNEQHLFPSKLASVRGGNAFYTHGRFVTAIDFGGTATATGIGTFVARHEGVGNAEWLVPIIGTGLVQAASAVGADSAGGVVVAGINAGDTTIDTTMITEPGYVAKLSATGNVAWAWASDGFIVLDIAAASDNAYFLIGSTDGPSSLNGTALDAPDGRGAMFVAMLDTNGNVEWADVIESSVAPMPRGAAVDADDNLFLVGSFNGTIDLGGGELSSDGDANDVFIASYDAQGNHRYSQRFGDASEDLAEDVAWTGDGFVIVGSFLGGIDFGADEPLTSITGQDMFAAKLDP